ncbi:SAM-dependent methyltransferase [Ameyamaea chiangmaiensis NBRC 103196]|uniref:Methyltransferase domain-containing protein n=1 Tax=Ameyamaea chiangmaiensis TaxID=442969 RepID=A0A850PED0_9PROT|nr:class I SAM-dependent methyltransferase [Ameyamaea chiangmaiensis]MBS4075723.1 methyltransferase domain-containing protein [Ameyamaea chiangmaiensis]NVN41223.1 methyltransferase domain-containing protein [Ameyamaea chiangmaiensis]GBQ70383.1 SAM-dependent methyltransferase [Ameyamaea chiangmaiensis NBRC 103196]
MSEPLLHGRQVFGNDPALYDEARPPYPAAVFTALRAYMPVAGARVFEIGAGTGKATVALLRDKPAHLTAVEPDARLACLLAQRTEAAGATCEIIVEPWEKALLGPASYDLGVAATSFHWLPQVDALGRVHQALRPGGVWAMWWTVFGDPDYPDAFHQRATSLFKGLQTSPSWERGQRPFGLDVAARVADLQDAGFENVQSEIVRWTIDMDAVGVQSLAATFSNVIRATPERRRVLLDALARLVDDAFGGSVRRHFVSPLYLARKPAR